MQAIQRTGFTWLAYFSLGFFAYLLSIGPVMEYLGEELDMSNTLYGLHLSSVAFGMSLAGMFAERLAARFGRPASFWLGGTGMALGTVSLIFGQNPYLTLVGAFGMGLLGGILLIMIQATLSDQFGEQRTIALTEANVIAVAFTAFMPVAVYLGVSYLGGWRFALWFGIALWLLILLFGNRMAFPAERQAAQAETADAELPRIFWLYCFVLALGVAAEWTVAAWTIEFFQTHLLYAKENATLLLSLFFGAMIIGRMVGSYLSHRYTALKLLFVAEILSLFSFPLLWLSSYPLLNMTGLFLVGLGIANFYPLCLSVLSTIGQAQPNKASARASQASGIAILLVPLVLGLVADSVGIFIAYGIGMVFLLLLPIIVGISMKKA